MSFVQDTVERTTSADASQGAKPLKCAMRDMVAALRISQWSKNLLVFVPLLITHDFAWATLAISALAFCSFSTAASATYIFNDICDVDADRSHARKQKRPFASGDLRPRTGFFMIVGLAIGSLTIAASLPAGFVWVLALYVVSSAAYTLALKRILGLDLVLIACLYVMRITAGDEAVGADFQGLDSSAWILGFSCLFFLSLAIVKRCSDLSLIRAGEAAEMHGRAYQSEDYPVLIAIAGASAMASITVLMLYLGSADVAENFSRSQVLWLAVPVLAYWLIRLILLANRGAIAEDPVIFTLRDA